MKSLTSVNFNNDEVVGRLGNKLFVIAAGLGAADLDPESEFFVPAWTYQSDLPNVPVKEPLSGYDIDTYTEKAFSYDPIPTLKEQGNISGYFQSEKYFKHIEKQIKHLYFHPSNAILETVDSIFKYVKDYNITSIHVRRGDYVEKKEFHPPQTMEYYNEAMDSFDKKTDRFLLFSDDIAWCKENFKNEKCLFSEGKSDIEDLFLMAECNNHIISNSSYSWWGAWLSKHKDSQVIAPKNWFGPQLPLETKDLYCEGWKVL